MGSEDLATWGARLAPAERYAESLEKVPLCDLTDDGLAQFQREYTALLGAAEWRPGDLVDEGVGAPGSALEGALLVRAEDLERRVHRLNLAVLAEVRRRRLLARSV